MPHGQCNGAVCTLFRVQPLVTQFGDFSIIGSDRDSFGTFIADFGEEVRVRGTGLRDVGTPGNQIRGVIPVCGFRHVSLLTPGLRGGRR